MTALRLSVTLVSLCGALAGIFMLIAVNAPWYFIALVGFACSCLVLSICLEIKEKLDE